MRTHPSTLVEVALSIGYDSEVAFSKAFKRYFGIAPGAYRQGKRAAQSFSYFVESISFDHPLGTDTDILPEEPL